MTAVAAVPNDPVLSLIQSIHDKFVSGLSSQKAQALGKRPDRALVLASEGAVIETDEPGVYKVVSSGDSNIKYTVDLNNRTCTCPDSSRNGNVCKHRIAAYYFRESAQKSEDIPEADPVKVSNGGDHPKVVRWMLSLPHRMKGDFMIYANLDLGDGKVILVEILNAISDLNVAYVKALPILNGGEDPEFIFPFPSPYEDGSNVPLYSTAYVSKLELKDVRVYQKED